MLSSDRRMGFRVPVDIFLNQYIRDQPFRALASNVSETGIFLNRVKHLPVGAPTTVGLEFELPATGEVIWARGEICHRSLDRYFHCDGVRFTAMPVVHARLLRDYCIESRRHQLGTLLAKIRNPSCASSVH